MGGYEAGEVAAAAIEKNDLVGVAVLLIIATGLTVRTLHHYDEIRLLSLGDPEPAG